MITALDTNIPFRLVVGQTIRGHRGGLDLPRKPLDPSRYRLDFPELPLL